MKRGMIGVKSLKNKLSSFVLQEQAKKAVMQLKVSSCFFLHSHLMVGLGMLGGDCTESGCSLQSAGVDGTVLDVLKGKGVV